jgi:ATP-binding protein involved in chromosome partitioning
MATTHDIENALRGVVDPELGGDVVELGMIKGIELADETATITVALTIAGCPMRSQIEGDVKRKVAALPGIESVIVTMGEMTQEERSEVMSKARFRSPASLR